MKIINEDKKSLKESYVEEWWGQVDEDPFKFASEYNLKCSKLKTRGDETLYRFTGRLLDIDEAMRFGYFYSVYEGEDEGHSKDIDEILVKSILKEDNQNSAHSFKTSFGIFIKKQIESGKTPTVNVYLDRSGSWRESDYAVAKEAIAGLKKYVSKGLLKINTYYFDTNVANDASSLKTGGTDISKVLNHIDRTSPDDVIIVTDEDSNFIWKNSNSVTVPGAVWFLWKGKGADKLKNYLKGQSLNKEFKIM